ncbi:MAG: ATP-dependent sacrificial sulfur transferase LarE [Propionibacteriales bacterium]|nr:ATP-dependent sacrificial sulfur transferase LarE [Propionibacteriales bacterium]
MTLIDSRPGVRAALELLAARTGTPIDAALAVSRLGPPLEQELAEWFPPDRVAATADLYRALYADAAIEPTEAMPGAREALDSLRRRGAASLVVTAKNEADARRHVDHLGLDVDAVVGGLWGAGKGVALAQHGATVYVGDHVLDVAGAHSAGALSVVVTTGPCSADELAAAGADVVLRDLTELPGWLDEHVLLQRMRPLGSVLVAFSGGADSALVLAAAVKALGPDNVAAATAVSDSLADAELADARAFAAELGVRWLSPRTYEMQRAGYRANDGDRCYFCKAELLDVLTPLAAEHGLAYVATGTNADDVLAGFRPGIRAASERGAVTPLADAGLAKAQVRALSRAWGLRTWDKPAAACLSSRIAYGVEVTPHRLARVQRAEAGVRAALGALGHPVRDLRVRDLGDEARVEVEPALVQVAGEAPEVEAAVRSAGFTVLQVAVFRSGSMNAVLDDRFR